MRIAVFDYGITSTNPIGGCHLRMLRSLCHEHDFTVFAVKFENPDPERIHWIQIPVPVRPLALLYVAFHLLAPLYYWAYRLWHREQFSLVQMVESNLSFGDVAYSQFCHRAYLKHHWKQSRASGLRGWLRWLDHRLHALMEPWIYRRVRCVVVPSHGLSRELSSEYPTIENKIHILPNPVDIERMHSPAEFDRESFRRNLGLLSEELSLVFVALGQFERKGLPLLLEALQHVNNPRLKLVVVGGEPDLVAAYQSNAKRLSLDGQVVFTGMQRDVRPYLWSADAFTFPSFYETFSLVSFEAAAAGLPLIVTPLYGVEEFIRDGENGILVEGTLNGITEGIIRFLTLTPEARRAMGEQARRAVEAYNVDSFLYSWRNFYRTLDGRFTSVMSSKSA
jgi:glycosyltransferase involved in cell wall biosynthesis